MTDIDTVVILLYIVAQTSIVNYLGIFIFPSFNGVSLIFFDILNRYYNLPIPYQEDQMENC